jgi:hypothetical protein
MYPLLLILFIGAALLRVGSVAVSKRNEKALKARGAREYGRSTSRLLAAAHTLFYGGALLEGLWRRTQPSPWTKVGLLLYGRARWPRSSAASCRDFDRQIVDSPDHRLNQSALSLGPAPELFPQHHPGISRPSSSWPDRALGLSLLPWCPEADHAE